jgi:hypothetical protein
MMEQVIKTYSPNNTFNKIAYANGGCRIQISNSVLKEETIFETDTEIEARLISERVMHYYSCKESDYTYYPCTNVSSHAGSFWRFDIVGMLYRDESSIIKASKVRQGELLLLVRERNNPKDPNAIRVLTVDGIHIGYVPARRCSDVSSKMGIVGVCWAEQNNFEYKEFITVRFSFEICKLEDLDENLLNKPGVRIRIDKNNPFAGRLYEVQGRFKLFPSQGEVHYVMRDFGAIPYWEDHITHRPELLVLGSSSPVETLEIVERQKAENPELEVIKETELASIMDLYNPGWMAKLAKPKAEKKPIPKGVGSARAYISKTLKKMESGADPEAFRQSLQERVDIIITANEPMGESLRQRLRAFGVNC